MYNVGFIGNKMETAELLSHDPDICLKFVVSEIEKTTDELITFSLVRKIKLYQIKKITSLSKILKNKKIDFCIMHDFGKKIPIKIIQFLDIYNIHPSHLPYYKGRHPLFWATLNNEKNIGISLHKVESKVDNGPIISQRKIPYYLWISTKEISNRLIEKVPDLIGELKEYLKGKRKSKANLGGSYYKPVSKKDIEISLKNDSPDKIYNKVRSQGQYKGGKLILGRETIWIKSLKFAKSLLAKKYKLGEKYYDKNGDSCIYYKKGISIKLLKYTIE